jgi:hypothetical protein
MHLPSSQAGGTFWAAAANGQHSAIAVMQKIRIKSSKMRLPRGRPVNDAAL